MVDALKDSASLKASRLRLEGETTKEELAQKRLKLEHDIAMDKQNALDKESEPSRQTPKRHERLNSTCCKCKCLGA